MIPPTSSLVKYDNPILVSRNTEKKSPRVCEKIQLLIVKAFITHQWKEKDQLILPILGFTMFPSTGMEIIDVEHNSQDIFFKNSKIPIFFS